MSRVVRACMALRAWSAWAVLAVVWFGVLMPVGLVSRSVRTDPLQRRFEAVPSYWEDRAEVSRIDLLGFLRARGKLWLLPVLLVLLAVGLLVVLSESSAVLVLLYPLF